MSSARELRAMFGRTKLPGIDLSLAEVATEARRLAGKMSVSGVQPKLSMAVQGDRLVAVAERGQYILKPQTNDFAQLPENEALCMALAAEWGIPTAPNMLIRLKDGSPALLVRRFDRVRRGRRVSKLHCEHMQQILGADKYEGSHEAIAKAIAQHCTFPRVELQRFFELTLFNFAIGNGDAHKKNFSLLTRNNDTALSPAYDIVSSRLALPSEDTELALALSGKRNRLKGLDFVRFGKTIGLRAGLAEERTASLTEFLPQMRKAIEKSELTAERRGQLMDIVTGRVSRLAVVQ
jgi:serine/threonine-protein kinase HipA